jgi:hypothetical protein
LPASTSKKIVVTRFDRDSVPGFVQPQDYLRAEGLEVLSQSGAILLIPYAEIKAAYFVRDFAFEAGDEPRVFHTRPRSSGIWVRMRFRDGEIMDGLLPNNLLQVEPYGFMVMPPNPSSNNQWVFVPRAALDELQVLGVVGSPLKPQKQKPKPKEQISLFD